MRNNKTFLYGLGTGLILGSLLLQLVNSVSSQYNSSAAASPPAQALTTEQMKDKLEQSGYTIYKPVSETAKKQAPDSGQGSATQADSDQASAAQSPIAGDAAGTNGAKENGPAATAPEASGKNGKPVEWVITVHPGDSSEIVGDQLVGMGLIASRNVFEKAIEARNLGSKVRVGTYTFTHKPTVDEVIEKITSG